MTTNYHTPITTGAAANASVINAPISQIDSAIDAAAKAVNYTGSAPTLAEAVEYASGDIFNVRAFGAAGDGSTDDKTAIKAAIAAAAAGDVVFFPPGTYKTTSGFIVDKPISIVGSGPQTKIRLVTGGTADTYIALWVRSSMDSDSASAPVYGPLGGVTYYRTFSGTVSEGDETFTLASTTGLGVGTRCMLLLGVDPYDSTQPFLRQFNVVAGITGSDVTFTIPVPEDVNGTSHKCVTFDDIVENVVIRDLTFEYDGSFAMESCIHVDKCRNVQVSNIYMTTVTRGIVVEGSENTRIENVYAESVDDQPFLQAYGFLNLQARNLHVQDCAGSAVYVESQGRGCVIEGVYASRPSTASSGSQTLIAIGGCRGVVFKHCHLVHNNSCATMRIDEAAEVRTEDFWLWNSEYHTEFPLLQHSGMLHHNETLYAGPKRRWSRRIPLYASQNASYTLPSGIYSDVRVYTTNTANVTSINMNSGGVAWGGDILSLLTANALVRPATKNLTYVGNDASYPFNNTNAHTVSILCGSGMPAGQYIIFDIDYWPSAADDATMGLVHHEPWLLGTTTWDPANLADGASATTTVTVTGANIGDVVQVGFSSITSGAWQLCGHVTSANTVTIVLTNHTGGAVDLGSGTLRVAVWQGAG